MYLDWFLKGLTACVLAYVFWDIVWYRRKKIYRLTRYYKLKTIRFIKGKWWPKITDVKLNHRTKY